MTRITRVEVITDTGRDYVNWEDDNDITVSYQDNEKTLKIFVNKVKPKTGEEGALEALDKFQNDWLLGKKCPETKLEIKKLDSVESIKAEIKMLQSKLSFYEELEKQPKTLFDVIQNLGYSVDACYEIVDAVEEFEKSKEVEKLQEKDWDIKVETDYLTGKARHKWKIVDKDGNDYKPTPQTAEELLKPNWEPKPQNENEVAEGLSSAFREAVEQGVIPKAEKLKKNTDDFDDIIEKLKLDPPNCLKFSLGKTLEQLVTRWWCDVFTSKKYDWDMETAVQDLCDRIFLWLPKEQSYSGSQDLYAEVAVDAENDLLKKIKSKIHNKKDT